MAIDYDHSMRSLMPIVVFITHHADEMLWNALRSTLLSERWLRQLWVVHSNASQVDLPSEFDSRVHYHWLGGNFGFASAVNWIYKHAEGPVFIINDDTILNADCLEELYQASLQYPTSVLQPEIRLFDQPDTIENTGHYVGVDGNNSACQRGLQSTHSGISNRLCFSGAAFWVPEVIYRHPKLQTMDTSLSPFGEDLDYALRCIRYGFTIKCVHDATLLHRWGGSYERYSEQKVTWVESHRIQSKFRNLPMWMLLTAPLSSALRYGIGLQDSRIPSGKSHSAAIASLRGIYQGYRSLPKAIRKRRQENFTVSDWEFTKLWWRQT